MNRLYKQYIEILFNIMVRSKLACGCGRPCYRELALAALHFRWLPSFRTVSEKHPGICWETVSPKPKTFREFLGFWAGPFESTFREFLWFWSSQIFPGNFRQFVGFFSAGWFLVKIPGISGVLVRRGIFVKILGNCEVSVVVGISNYVSGSLRGLRWFGLSSTAVRGSEET